MSNHILSEVVVAVKQKHIAKNEADKKLNKKKRRGERDREGEREREE